ncbi:MAG: hypothetical protein CMJ19_01540 [Phycisphaeraceae bacterium]|nr:hypothetical protein [Phycisphaeraceae bacterium]
MDLKGLPPTPQRLISLLDLIVACGYNAILVEWEDTFPWKCDLRYRGATFYNQDVIKRFVDRCGELEIELIPLVQSIGHLEMALRLDDNEHLREQVDCFDCLNPLAPGAHQLVEAMVDDVLELMPDVKRFHLGGDEAWLFGSHESTRLYAQQNGKDRLYLYHLDPILDKLIDRGIRPLLWHDMMIQWDDAALQQLSQKADLAVWGYHGHPDYTQDHLYHTRVIERFSNLNVPMWACGAYKGADGMSFDRATFESRRENTLAWLDLDARFDFAGFIATGWSRYSTNRVQTSPLDGNQDVIVLLGQLFSGQSNPTLQQVNQLLLQARELDGFQKCSDILNLMQRRRKIAWEQVQEIHEMLTFMQYDKNRNDPWLVEQSCKKLANAIEDVEELSDELYNVFSGRVALCWMQEYVHERIAPLKEQLAVFQSIGSKVPVY